MTELTADARKRAATYTIEGQPLTLDQIAERVPHIKRQTIARRLRDGARTWAKLSQTTAQAYAEQRRRVSGARVRQAAVDIATPRR